MGLLDRAGARLTTRPEDAEKILVVNTCSFIDTAKQESVDTILSRAKSRDPAAKRTGNFAGFLDSAALRSE